MAQKPTAKVLVNPIGELYTTEEAAQMLRISTRTILRAIEAGQIKAKRVGRGYRITKDALAAYWQGAPDRAR